MEGGDTDKAVVPGNPAASLLVTAIRYADEDLQMPPKMAMPEEEIELLEEWIRRGAPGPKDDMGTTEFSQLGDQTHLFAKAKDHWAFQPVDAVDPAEVDDPRWNRTVIDRFIFAKLAENGLTPSPRANAQTLRRRLTYDLTGLAPDSTGEPDLDALLASLAFGEHFTSLWLDVARYADTDSAYRPDAKAVYRFPFAWTYRDYVIASFNADKPYDQFLREQLAADHLGLANDAPELAALGFLGMAPHANRNPTEVLDDWIDATTRGLMGMTVACARCHDHKYEPIPTADYYALRGVFESTARIDELDEAKLPVLASYQPSKADRKDYETKRAALDGKIAKAGSKKAGNNRSVAQKLRDTELATLLAFHPGGPAHMMTVRDEKKISAEHFILIRGDAAMRGDPVARRFLKILDPAQQAFPAKTSGRLQLAEKITDPENPLTARVFVNRVWGYLIGSHLVRTPSDFGLQGEAPSHPELLDWLAADFVKHGWSLKHIVRRIVDSEVYRQSSRHRKEMAGIDLENRLLWRANRKRLSFEQLRDSVLQASGQLDRSIGGRPELFWSDQATRRRAIYGYINRFNLDPTLRAFDFANPMQTQPKRDESIVASQALFTLNSPFVIRQTAAIVDTEQFRSLSSHEARLHHLFSTILRRSPDHLELPRTLKFVERESRPLSWQLVAQSLMMSNEFQYID